MYKRQFLDSAGDNYAILQLRDIEETRMERFSSLKMLERMGMEDVYKRQPMP